LDLLDQDPEKQSAQLRALAQQMADEPDFVQRPSWQGLCAETGPWTRLRHRDTGKAAQHSAWTRLSARWLDLVELTQASNRGNDAAPLLASGALRLGPGQALAWCEMARGLLLHWVQLDATGAVQDYRVLAPTEWNFHPQAVLARAVASLPAGEAHTAQMLAAAFDPCVACTVQSPAGA
jgi:coenzyme F420-reducing hydrogenase alpha subunit